MTTHSSPGALTTMSFREVTQQMHDAVVEEFGDSYLSQAVRTGTSGDDVELKTPVDIGVPDVATPPQESPGLFNAGEHLTQQTSIYLFNTTHAAYPQPSNSSTPSYKSATATPLEYQHTPHQPPSPSWTSGQSVVRRVLRYHGRGVWDSFLSRTSVRATQIIPSQMSVPLISN